jgi:predicted NBD/HSP70 family sugar kinase
LKEKAGNPKTIRVKNQKILAQYLFKHGATSRAELSKVFNLSSPSIYKNISQLIEQNVVIEIGEGGSIGGRKPMLINFNYNFGYIISIDLRGEYLKLALANLALEIIEKQEIPINEYQSGKDLIIESMEAIKRLLEKHAIDRKNLLCIAIGFPAAVNQKTGQINMPPLWFNVWDKIDIEGLIKNEFATSKIILKNDINLAAIGEKRYGIGKNYKNLVYIGIDMGIGAGIVINGNIYEGSRFSAGEIGYLKTSIDSTNILEDHTSISGIINRINHDITRYRDDKIKRFLTNDQSMLDFETVKGAVEQKDPYIMEIMKNLTNRLGLVLSHISVLLDIELIILGGKVLDMGYDIKKDIDEILKRNVLLETQTGLASLNSDEVIYGGFALSLDYILKNIVNDEKSLSIK